MGRREEKISTEKGKGDNSSRRAVTIDFTEKKPEKKVEKKATPKKKPTKKKATADVDWEHKPLSKRQEDFCQLYTKLNNGEQAAIQAGYSPRSAGMIASENLRKPNVAKRLKELRDKQARPSIASGAEVMELLTKMARGEMKDEVGLDISPSDRLKALTELAKRTVDLDQKLAGKADTTIAIKLDWGESKPTQPKDEDDGK